VKEKDKKTLKNQDVYTIHIGKGSWESKDTKVLLFLARNWVILLFIVFGLFVPMILGRIVFRKKL
jgi:hypothetical protein